MRGVIVPVLLFFLSRTSGAPPNANDLYIPLIEAEAQKLNLADFEGDPIFIQTIDPSTSVSEYRLVQDNVTLENPTFQRNVDDSGKEIIVLLPSTSKQSSRNTYVVLRRRSVNNEYYATYAYAR